MLLMQESHKKHRKACLWLQSKCSWSGERHQTDSRMNQSCWEEMSPRPCASGGCPCGSGDTLSPREPSPGTGRHATQWHRSECPWPFPSPMGPQGVLRWGQ